MSYLEQVANLLEAAEPQVGRILNVTVRLALVIMGFAGIMVFLVRYLVTRRCKGSELER